ncbi:MAG: hypothetical protein ACEQR8_11990 [Cypionkella sp.]
MKLIPSAPEVAKEAINTIAGALLAAFIIGQLPAVKAWIKTQWGDTPRN